MFEESGVVFVTGANEDDGSDSTTSVDIGNETTGVDDFVEHD